MNFYKFSEEHIIEPIKIWEFKDIMYWKDYLGFVQYFGDLIIYTDRIEYSGKGGFGVKGKNFSIIILKDEINKLYIGELALNIVTDKEKYQFPLDKFKMENDQLLELFIDGMGLHN